MSSANAADFTLGKVIGRLRQRRVPARQFVIDISSTIPV
jgi:hypothetical protein